MSSYKQFLLVISALSLVVILGLRGVPLNQVFAATNEGGSGGGGDNTINCLPGQEANNDLGTCQDPICGPGEQRDPSGNTRYCVPISCPQGMTFNSDINQCVSNNPPPDLTCPDGSQGTAVKGPSGQILVDCPKTLPPPGTDHHPKGTDLGQIGGSLLNNENNPPPTGDNNNKPSKHHKGGNEALQQQLPQEPTTQPSS